MKKTLLGLLLILFVIQFIRPAINDVPVETSHAIGSGPAILKVSCYDCHSNHTSYPWYDKIQPVAWYLAHHVSEGRRELNFDEFNTYPLKKKKKKLTEIAEQVKEGEMPLASYTIIHKDAILNAQQQQKIIQWADSLNNSLN